MASVDITFPGNLAQVDTANDLRGVPSSLIPAGTAYIVSSLTGIFLYYPGVVTADNGTTVLKPNDITPLQAGRWIYTAAGFARGPRGLTGGNVDFVGLFTELSTIQPIIGTNRITTAGYRKTGQGAARLLRFSPPMANLPALVAGANPWYGTIADGSTWYLDPFQQVDFDMFGSYGDDVADDYPAFLAMQQFCRWRSGYVSGDGYSLGGRVSFPARNYYSSKSWRIKTTLRLEGPATGMAGGSEQNRNFHIRFPAGVDGIVVESFDTLNGPENPYTGGGNGTILDGLTVVGAGATAAGVAHGVRLISRATVRNCNVNAWSGDGIHINSGDGGNDNGCHIENNRIIIIGGSGIYSRGGDGNACTFVGNDISNVGRWGIEDRSFLNNHHAGNQIEGAGGIVGQGGRTKPSMVSYGGNYYSVAYDQDATASTTVPGTNSAVWIPTAGPGTINSQFPLWSSGTAYASGGAVLLTSDSAATGVYSMYVEPDCGSVQSFGLATFYSGNIQCDILGGSPDIFTGTGGVFASTRSMGVIARGKTAAGGTHTTLVGSTSYNPTGGTLLRDTHSVFTPSGMNFAHDGGGNITWTDGNGTLIFYITTPATSIRGGATVVQDRFGLNGLLFHGPGSPMLWTKAGAPPTTGTYQLYDRVYNDGSGASSPATVDFWWCSAAGTPGTWTAKA